MNREVVVGLYAKSPGRIRPDQAGHYRNPKDPDRTLCGLPIVDRKTTKQFCCCSTCWVLNERSEACPTDTTIQ